MAENSVIEDFIEKGPEQAQSQAKVLYKLLKSLLPEAEECLAYAIPTFKMKKNIIHFAPYEKHIGLYPGSKAIEHFKSRLNEYSTSKGTIQFPLDKKLPTKLITEIVNFQLETMNADKP